MYSLCSPIMLCFRVPLSVSHRRTEPLGVSEQHGSPRASVHQRQQHTAQQRRSAAVHTRLQRPSSGRPAVREDHTLSVSERSGGVSAGQFPAVSGQWTQPRGQQHNIRSASVFRKHGPARGRDHLAPHRTEQPNTAHITTVHTRDLPVSHSPAGHQALFPELLIRALLAPAV